MNAPKNTQAIVSMLVEAANIPDVQLYLDAIGEGFDKVRQQQHEATWAMAMEAAAKKVDALDNTQMKQRIAADHVRAIPCPPLQRS